MKKNTPTSIATAVIAAYATGERLLVAYTAQDGTTTERTATVSEIKSHGVIFETEKGKRLMLWSGITSV